MVRVARTGWLGAGWFCTWGVLFAVSLVVVPGAVQAAEIPIADVRRDGPVDFQKEILPILRQKCLPCHNVTAKKGSLVLETPALMQKGGDSGPAVVPGNGLESLLLQVAAHRTEPHMPPPNNPAGAQPMTPEELGLLKLWIDQGAKGDVPLVLSPQRWQPIPASYAPVLAVALSPDGQLAACSRGNQIFLYNVANGALQAQLSDPALAEVSAGSGAAPAHRDVVQCLAFHPQGDLLASGGFREVKLWRRPRDVRSWQVQLGVRATALAVAPQTGYVAVGDEQGVVRVWKSGENQPIATLTGHSGPIKAVAFSLDQHQVISGGEDRSLRVWTLPGGQLVRQVDTATPVRALAVLGPLPPRDNDPFLAGENITWLATAGEDNAVHLWSLAVPPADSWAELGTPLPGLIAAYGRWLATVDSNKTLRLGDIVTRQILRSWPLQQVPNRIALVRSTGDGATDQPPDLFVGYADGLWQLWHSAQDVPRASGVVGVIPAKAWAITQDGQQLVVGGENGLAAVYQTQPQLPALSESLGLKSLDQWALSLDQQGLILAGAGDNQGMLIVSDLASGTIVGRRSMNEPVLAVAISADKGRIAFGTARGVYVAQGRDAGLADSGSLLELPSPATALGLSPDGQWLLAACQDQVARLWNLADTSRVTELKGHQGAIVAAAVLPGNQLVTASADRTIRFWNAGDGAQQRSVDFPEAVRGVTWSVDSSKMVVATADGHVRIVETASGRQLIDLQTPWPEVRYAILRRDADQLLVVAPGHGVAVYEVDYGRSATRLLEKSSDAELAHGFWGIGGPYWYALHRNGAWQRMPVRFQRALVGMDQPIVALRFHPNGQQVYSLSADGSLRGHRVGDGQPFFAVGHGGPARDLAISSDGQWLATCGENGQVRLFQSGNGGNPPGQPAGAFSGPAVYVAFTPDGSRLVAVGKDSSWQVRVWEVATGILRERMVQQSSEITGLALAGDGLGRVVSTTADGAPRVWSLHAVKLLTGSSQEVTSLASVPQSPQELWAGSRDGNLRRWNVLSGQVVQQLSHGSAVLAVALRPDGQRLASAGDNGTTRLWNLQNGQVVAELRGDIRLKNAVAAWNRQVAQAEARLNLAKQRLDAAQKDLPVKQEAFKKATEALEAAKKDVEAKTAQVRMALETKTAQEKAAIEAAAAAQRALMAKQQADQLAMKTAQTAKLSRERAERLAALARSAPMDANLARAAEEARRMADDAQNQAQQAASAQPPAQQAYEAAARAANEATAKVAEVQKPYNDAVTALRSAEKTLDLASQNHTIAQRELQAAEAAVPAAQQAVATAEQTLQNAKTQLEQAQQQDNAAQLAARSLAFSPDGTLLASGGNYPNVHLWDGDSGTAIEAFAGHSQPITSVAFANGTQFVSCSEDGQVLRWESQPAWQLERTLGGLDAVSLFSHRVMALDFSPDGTLLAAAGGVPSREGTIHLFQVADGQLVRALPDAHNDTVYAVKFSPDGKRIASASADKTVKIFRVADGTLLRRLEGHTNYVLSVAWRSDGSLLATGSADRTVKVWDAETGDQQRTIEGFGRPVTAVQFMGESDNTVSGCGDGVIRMHNNGNGNFRNFGGAGYVHNLQLSGDQQRLLAGSADGRLRLWNATNGQLLRTWPTQ